MTPTLPHLCSLLAAATPGPWRFAPDERNERSNGDMERFVGTIKAADPKTGEWHVASVERDGLHPEEDAALIVAAVSALPALIEVAEAAKEVQRAKAEWHRRRPFYSTAEAHSRVTMAEHYLAEALAKLEAP